MQNKEYQEINGFNIEYYKYTNIFIVRNFLNESICDSLINEINNSYCSKLSKTSYNNVECFNATLKHEKTKTFIEEKLRQISETLSNFKNIPIIGLTKPEYRKVYGKTHLHADGACVETVIDINTLCKTKQVRSLTLVCALNDNFDGGIHKFPEIDFEIKLGKGWLIAFPPYWTHKHMVTSVENNTFRYTISCWALDNYLCEDVNHSNIIILDI